MSDLLPFSNPFVGLTGLHSQLDDMVNSFFSGMPASPAHGIPAMDVFTEDDKDLVAEVQAPGFSKEDIDVHVHEGILEIKGEKHDKEEQKDKKRSYVVRETNASFYRSIALPKNVDADNVKAAFENGVLRVTIPFKELPAPKKIAITSSKK